MADTHAFVVNALLALLVAFMMKRFWKFIRAFCFFASMRYCRRPTQETLSVFERNVAANSSPFESLVAVCRTPVADLSIGLMALGVGCFLYACGTVALAALLSWQLTLGTDENPLVRASCDSLYNPIADRSLPDDQRRSLVTRKSQYLSDFATIYQRNCYEDEAAVACNSNLATRRLEYKEVREGIGCVFQGDLCEQRDGRSNTVNAVRFETEFLDLADLGIVSQSGITIRRALSAQVLNSSTFSEQDPSSDALVQYVFGNGSTDLFLYNVNTAAARGYQVETVDQKDESTFDPRLSRGDGSVTMVLVGHAGILYLQPNSDPVFSANQPIVYRSGRRRWTADQNITIVGCVDQFEVCNNATGFCTGWTSAERFITPPYDPRLASSDTVKGILLLLADMLLLVTVKGVIEGRGGASLVASISLNRGNQESLVAGPWRREIETWFSTSLAKMQLHVHSMATGARYIPRAEGYLNAFEQNPWIEFKDILCRLLVFRSGAHTSMDLTGVLVVISLAMLFSILSFFDHLDEARYARLSPRLQRAVSEWKVRQNPSSKSHELFCQQFLKTWLISA